MLRPIDLALVSEALHEARSKLVKARDVVAPIERANAPALDTELFHTLEFFRHGLAILNERIAKRLAVEAGEKKLTESSRT